MSFLTNLSLGKKITLLTTVGLLLGVGVFSSLGMRAVNQATEAMLQDRLTTARLVASYLDESLGHALGELNKTARTVNTGQDKNELRLQMEALTDIYSRLTIYTHSIYLLNQDGKVIYSQPETTMANDATLAAYPAITQALRGARTSISGLVLAPIADVPVIILTSPTGETAPGNNGLLVVAVDPARSGIGGFVQPIRLGQTGYVEIVDQNGTVVTRTKPGPVLAPFEKSDHSGRFVALIDAGKPTRGVCHTCHVSEQRVEKRDVLAFVPLSVAKWGVVVRQSEEEALGPTRELRQNLLLFGFGLVAIALLFVFVTTRDIGTRIKMLTTASQRITEGDLISTIPSSGRDEVGILAQTFDNMRVRLKASLDELERKTKELSSLLSVSEILTSTTELPRLLEAVVARTVEVIPGADGGALLLRDTDQPQVKLQCAIGLDELSLTHLKLIPDMPDSIEERESVKRAVTSFLQSDSLRSRVQSSISAEIHHRQRHIGSIILMSFRDRQSFADPDRRLLQGIADYIALAIEKNQLVQEAEEARAWQEADRLRSEFISSVSHELRTPLTLIKGYSTSLMRRDTSWDRETQQEFLRIIDEKTDELRDLIDKLLQSAKLEAGAFRLEKEPVLLPRLARKVVDDLQMRAKKHHFTLNFTPSFPVIEADVRCMEQVLRNLIENAVKYSPEGGEVTINGEAKDGTLLVSVSDEGMGIPEEHQDKVFQRFYRVGNALTHSISGTGLGLSIVKGHIEAHGGKVWLESIPDKGSTFYFSLPLERRESGE